MNVQEIPIYQRYHNPRTRHFLSCSYRDVVDGWERMLDPHYLTTQLNVHGCYKSWGSPSLAFVGDSSMSRLLFFRHDPHVSTRIRSFMEHSYFIAVGGLKYWTAENYLNGILPNYDKWVKYGNQWTFFDDKSVKIDYWICRVGENDCDDVNAHFVDLKSSNSHDDYVLQTELESDLWLEALKPHIHNFFGEIKRRDSSPYICYLPIAPRFWWLAETRRFMARLNYYIIARLGKELNVKIKTIPCRSLYKTPIRSLTNELTPDDIMTAYYEYDCVHLNYWGNEVMMHDIALGLVGNWSSTVQGGRWGTRRWKIKPKVLA